MKKQGLFFIFIFYCYSLSAQLVNNGGTIFIEQGATISVQGSVLNDAGSITNNGIFEIKGDLINDGIVSSSAGASLIFSGTDEADFEPGTGSTYTNIMMNKEDNEVILNGDLSVLDSIKFTGENTKMLLGDNDLTLGALTVVAEADNNEYFVTDGTGSLVREFNAAGIDIFHVGDSTNYSPLNVDLTGTTIGASANLAVQVSPTSADDKPALANDYINRHWNVVASDMTDYSNSLEGTYVIADISVDGDANLVKGASYDGMEWNFFDAGNDVSKVTGTVSDDNAVFTGMNFFGKAGFKIFLDGPYNGTDMTATLNTDGILEAHALVSPYGDGASVASGFFDLNETIVDWVYLESRNSTTPATIEGGSSAFLLSNGNIVGLDGSSAPLIKNAGNTGYVVLKHRNHLSISTSNFIDLMGTTPTIDFTNTATSSYGTNGLKNNGGTMTMWAGDVNGDGKILDNSTPSDIILVRNAVLTFPGNTGAFGSGPLSNYANITDVYSLIDTNMDGKILDNASPSDAINISSNVLSHPGNTGAFGSGPLSNYTGLTAQTPQ